MAEKDKLKTIAGKIAVLAIVIYLIVPASVLLSDKIYQIQGTKIQDTITQYDELDIQDESDTGFLGELSTVTSSTIDKISAFISSLMESLAIMIVTACVVPVLVFVFLVWLVKTIFASNALSIDSDSLGKLMDRIGKKE